jgi:uncharacterized protein (DUF486 family)
MPDANGLDSGLTPVNSICWVVHIPWGMELFSYPLTLPCRRGVKEKGYELDR